jgi:hypothetical protein
MMYYLVNCIGSHPYRTEELHNLHSSPNVIRVIKSRRVGHVARMGIGGMHMRFWWESRKETYHWEDLNVGERIILKIDLRDIRWSGMNWICLA